MSKLSAYLRARPSGFYARPLVALAILAALGGTAAAQFGSWAPGPIAAKPKSHPHAQPARRLQPGRDVDGDGAPDFQNPTGRSARGWDHYGSGAFGASRDGGARHHQGVDYVAAAGQAVVAPISGYVTKIGYCYAGDAGLRYVELTNPALGYTARVFYLDPTVEVGQAVRLGQGIGHARTLQRRYPGGIIDHVHLELTQIGKGVVNAAALLPPGPSSEALG